MHLFLKENYFRTRLAYQDLTDNLLFFLLPIECIDEVGKRMGSVDIVVNNAGILDEAAINKTIDINLVSIPVW